MTEYFRTLTDFEVPAEIINRIKVDDWQNMPLASRYNRWFTFKYWMQNFPLYSYPYFQRRYGHFFNKVGTLDSYILEDDVVNDVKDYVASYFGLNQDQKEDIVVRLQVIYGGQGKPLHIDRTRTAALVVPIKHNYPAETAFFEYYGGDKKLGLMNPALCREVARTSVVRDPALIDAKAVHSVEFKGGNYTAKDPRISLNIKWKETPFQELLEILDSK